MATESGTHGYRTEHGGDFGRTYFRQLGDFAVSSIGLGTYLGDPTDEVDEEYYDAITTAVEGGINVVDTAINYRCQRSERVVGRALATPTSTAMPSSSRPKADSSPSTGSAPTNPGSTSNGSSWTPASSIRTTSFAEATASRRTTSTTSWTGRSTTSRLDTVDCYYVHNPETQLYSNSPEEVYDRLEATFTRLEERAAAGDIRYYGVATWNAFRVPEGHDDYLSLREVVSRARSAAKAAENTMTHFRVVQLPFNVVMADAFTVESQDGPDGKQSALRFAHEAGLNVVTSASIAQGDLAAGMPEEVAEQLAGETTAQRAINFARSAPGVTSSLVGASTASHVRENLDAGRYDPMGANAFDAVFE